MSRIPIEMQPALLRQRRFLILMSVALIAFYYFRVHVKGEAQYSGLLLQLDEPDRVTSALWAVWGWAVLRYAQRVYELLSVMWDEVREDVDAEDDRIALSKFKRMIKKDAIRMKIAGVSASARVIGRVRHSAEIGEDRNGVPRILPANKEPTPPLYQWESDGSRAYSNMAAILDRRDGAPPTVHRFPVNLDKNEVRFIRIRAWIYGVVALPAFSEHIAPFFIAVAVPLFAWFSSTQCSP